jgi:CxxC motif-containing protein
MKDTTKYKSVSFPAPDRINLAKPVKTVDILNKKVFGKGQKTVQGKGAATKGTKFNISPSGHR